MSGILILLVFGTWILAAVVMVLFLALPPCRKILGRQIHPLRFVALLVLSGVVAAAMVWMTGGNVLLALMSPVGLTLSMFCCVIGIIFGARKLVQVRHKALAGFWLAFFIPPLAFSTLRVADLILFKEVAIERGTFTGSKTFHFGNFRSLVVDGHSVEFAFKHYNRPGDMLHVPYDVLELKMDGHRRVVSDQCGNNALIVDGRKYAVTAALRLGAAGSPLMDESVRHPGLPLPVHVKDPLKVE